MADMKVLAGKRVLLVVENNAVPFDRRVWREALALRDAGAYVSVICPVFGEDSSRFSVIDGIEIHRYPLTFSNGSAFGYIREYAAAFLQTFLLFHRVLRRAGRPHVVHVANPPDIFWPLGIYVQFFGARFIFDEHDLTPETYLSRYEIEEHSGGMLYRVLVLFQRLSYRVSHAIIATNQSYRDRTNGLHPRYAEKTFIVRNGPDTRYFTSSEANPSLKRGHKHLGAYIGIMAVQDGVDYVIRAMDLLVNERSFKDLIVYLIGSGDDVPRLKEMTRSLRLEEYIVFTGRIPDKPALEILSTADICLSPDPYNPLNNLSTMNKVMEYMTLGKPIISFDLKEARFSAGGSALYVENNNVHAFANGIQELLGDPEKCKRMGESGRERVDSELCWQRQASHLLDAYKHVLGEVSRVAAPQLGRK